MPNKSSINVNYFKRIISVCIDVNYTVVYNHTYACAVWINNTFSELPTHFHLLCKSFKSTVNIEISNKNYVSKAVYSNHASMKIATIPHIHTAVLYSINTNFNDIFLFIRAGDKSLE